MTGEDPDPRYLLANERTFLAWIRTALGLLAGAAGLLAVDLPWPESAVRALAIVLAVTSGFAAIFAWDRWRRVNAAIEAAQSAPRPRAHVLLAIVVAGVAVAVVLLAMA